MAQVLQNRGNITNVGTAIGRSITAATRSKLGSIEYMQRITRSTFEHILFSRIDFARNEFKHLIINDNNYSVLRNNVKNPTLVKFKTMMDSLINLIQHDFVKQVDMMFANVNDPDYPLEFYTLKFFIPAGSQNLDYHIQRKMTNSLRRNTSELFTNVAFLDDNYKVLQHEEIGIRFTILLRDRKDTQSINQLIKLQPDHLHEGKIALRNAQEKFVHNFKLGKMKTGFHTIFGGAKGGVYELYQDMVVMHAYESNSNPAIETESFPDPIETEGAVKCSCCITVKYDKVDMIQCQKCNTYQHGVCFFFRDKKEFPGWYACPDCIIHNVEKPSTVDCLIRLVTAVCHGYGEYPEYIFDQQLPGFRMLFLRFCVEIGFFQKRRNTYQVIRETVNEDLMKRMFDKPDDFQLFEDQQRYKRRRL